MSGFIREMMPDNIPELFLTAGTCLGSYLFCSHYGQSIKELKVLNQDSIKVLREQEQMFLDRIRELKDKHDNLTERNTISDEAISYLRGLK